jgi:hypothetical protein
VELYAVRDRSWTIERNKCVNAPASAASNRLVLLLLLLPSGCFRRASARAASGCSASDSAWYGALRVDLRIARLWNPEAARVLCWHVPVDLQLPPAVARLIVAAFADGELADFGRCVPGLLVPDRALR